RVFRPTGGRDRRSSSRSARALADRRSGRRLRHQSLATDRASVAENDAVLRLIHRQENYSRRVSFLRSRWSEMLLGQANQLLETRSIFDGHVAQHLAVQQNLGFLQGIDEAAVGEAVRSGRCANPGDPQLPEVPLSILAARIRVLLSLVHRFRGGTKQPAFRAVLPFRQFESLFPSRSCFRPTFCAWHDSILPS